GGRRGVGGGGDVSGQKLLLDRSQPPGARGAPGGFPAPPGGGARGANELALAELETTTGALLPILLALLDPGVPGEEPRLLALPPQLEVERAEGGRDAVAEGPRLGGDSAPVKGRVDVELLYRLRHRERLAHQHLERLVAAEILVQRPLVELHLAVARAQVDPR